MVTAQANAGEPKILMFLKIALSPCSFVSKLLPLLKLLTLQSFHVAWQPLRDPVLVLQEDFGQSQVHDSILLGWSNPLVLSVGRTEWLMSG